jgi:hypothetical protein
MSSSSTEKKGMALPRRTVSPIPKRLLAKTALAEAATPFSPPPKDELSTMNSMSSGARP